MGQALNRGALNQVPGTSPGGFQLDEGVRNDIGRQALLTLGLGLLNQQKTNLPNGNTVLDFGGTISNALGSSLGGINSRVDTANRQGVALGELDRRTAADAQRTSDSRINQQLNQQLFDQRQTAFGIEAEDRAQNELGREGLLNEAIDLNLGSREQLSVRTRPELFSLVESKKQSNADDIVIKESSESFARILGQRGVRDISAADIESASRTGQLPALLRLIPEPADPTTLDPLVDINGHQVPTSVIGALSEDLLNKNTAKRVVKEIDPATGRETTITKDVYVDPITKKVIEDPVQKQASVSSLISSLFPLAQVVEDGVNQVTPAAPQPTFSFSSGQGVTADEVPVPATPQSIQDLAAVGVGPSELNNIVGQLQRLGNETLTMSEVADRLAEVLERSGPAGLAGVLREFGISASTVIDPSRETPTPSSLALQTPGLF